MDRDKVLRLIVLGLCMLAIVAEFYVVPPVPLDDRIFYKELGIQIAFGIGLFVLGLTAGKAAYYHDTGRSNSKVRYKLKIQLSVLALALVAPLAAVLIVYSAFAVYQSYLNSPLRDPLCHPCIEWMAVGNVSALALGILSLWQIRKTAMNS